MKKKILSLLLATFLSFGIFSTVAFAVAGVAGFFIDWATDEATDKARGFIATAFEDSYKEKYSYLNCLRMFFRDSGLDYEAVGDIIALLAIQGPTSEQYSYLKSLCGNISDFDDFYEVFAPLCQSLYIKHNCYAADICDYIFSGNALEAGAQAMFDSLNNPIVSTNDLKEELINQNYLYTPKSGGVFKFGYRSEKYVAKIGNDFPILRFYNRDFGFCEQGYKDLWFVPYLLTESGELLLTQYQFHIYFDDWVPQNTDNVTDNNRYCLRVDVYSYVDTFDGLLLEDYYIISKSPNLSELPSFLTFRPYFSTDKPFVFYYTYSLSDYLQGYNNSSFQFAFSSSTKYYSSDLSSYVYAGSFQNPWSNTYAPAFAKTYADNPLKTADIGLLCSGEQIKFKYDFDIDRLPSNSTITISGDSVYDYSITDNSTGDTTTINEYVTNNYAFPENAGNTSGSGGGAGGKIEVVGKVEVGGKVDVDVNVNVNGAVGGFGGAIGNPGDYIGDTSGVDMDIASYIELIPKTSKSFIDFMKDFFSWLPAPIFGLIVLGFLLLVARIVLRR